MDACSGQLATPLGLTGKAVCGPEREKRKAENRDENAGPNAWPGVSGETGCGWCCDPHLSGGPTLGRSGLAPWKVSGL